MTVQGQVLSPGTVQIGRALDIPMYTELVEQR